MRLSASYDSRFDGVLGIRVNKYVMMYKTLHDDTYKIIWDEELFIATIEVLIS